MSHHYSGPDFGFPHGDARPQTETPLVLAFFEKLHPNLLPWSVVSRPLEGEAPKIDVAVGYSKSKKAQP
jgi:hypothetical protein